MNDNDYNSYDPYYYTRPYPYMSAMSSPTTMNQNQTADIFVYP